ncbi:endonuclease III [Rhodocytophaga rosea]|uniref:Endonuclease III n=1 Tax=Rhodocytophaga rosea TaxID=2704465 RepID=A0A6C0GMP5_9BACT|nr:endonuclease III [Rhodocytophaga rosea]QHT69295.1 endonuclease III [Rhodocytophaga rosea]
MQKEERFRHFIEYFTKNYEEPQTELSFNSPYELLVAVILSAQCTDKRVNMITPPLFDRFPTVHDLSKSHFDEVYSYIRSVSYPNNKTKHLLGMAQMLVNDFNGEVPATVEELQKLPGVGRKTAHVIASIVWNQPVMAVDTHVFRVSKRLGLADENANTPLAVELQLTPHIPEEYIAKAHHWLILHGRYICVARKPKCEICQLTHFCKYYEQNVAGNAISTNA